MQDSHQWTKDWDQRFSDNDTPWEEEKPPSILVELLSIHAAKTDRILEIGCGLGANVNFFAGKQCDIYGCDVSAVAVEKSKQKYPDIADRVFQMSVLEPSSDMLSSFDVLIDRGCLHTFKTQEAREKALEQAVKLLKVGGTMLLVEGNYDQGNTTEEIEEHGLPRLKASDIVLAAEPYFEIIEIKRCNYGEPGNDTDFLAWAAVLRKR